MDQFDLFKLNEIYDHKFEIISLTTEQQLLKLSSELFFLSGIWLPKRHIFYHFAAASKFTTGKQADTVDRFVLSLCTEISPSELAIIRHTKSKRIKKKDGNKTDK